MHRFSKSFFFLTTEFKIPSFWKSYILKIEKITEILKFKFKNCYLFEKVVILLQFSWSRDFE